MLESKEKQAGRLSFAEVFGGRKGDGGGNALTAGSKNSRCLFLIPASAFARVVLLRLRSAFADLTFRLLLSCACAARQQPTSVPPLDRVRQAAGGDAAKAAVLLYVVITGSSRSCRAASAITIRCRRPSQRLRALNRFSKSLRFFEKRALRRAVLPHCGRHSPALHFEGSGSRACALPAPSTSAIRALELRPASCRRHKPPSADFFRFFYFPTFPISYKPPKIKGFQWHRYALSSSK